MRRSSLLLFDTLVCDSIRFNSYSSNIRFSMSHPYTITFCSVLRMHHLIFVVQIFCRFVRYLFVFSVHLSIRPSSSEDALQGTLLLKCFISLRVIRLHASMYLFLLRLWRSSGIETKCLCWINLATTHLHHTTLVRFAVGRQVLVFPTRHLKDYSSKIVTAPIIPTAWGGVSLLE